VKASFHHRRANRAARPKTADIEDGRQLKQSLLRLLNRALDKCNASLKYTSLSGAVRKQQELIKRLGAREREL
jgi:hypothetical protein